MPTVKPIILLKLLGTITIDYGHRCSYLQPIWSLTCPYSYRIQESIECFGMQFQHSIPIFHLDSFSQVAQERRQSYMFCWCPSFWQNHWWSLSSHSCVPISSTGTALFLPSKLMVARISSFCGFLMHILPSIRCCVVVMLYYRYQLFDPPLFSSPFECSTYRLLVPWYR